MEEMPDQPSNTASNSEVEPLPDRLAFAVGTERQHVRGPWMRWDHSGKSGHYAPISWSN
jgi:hypothetical protein